MKKIYLRAPQGQDAHGKPFDTNHSIKVIYINIKVWINFVVIQFYFQSFFLVFDHVFLEIGDLLDEIFFICHKHLGTTILGASIQCNSLRNKILCSITIVRPLGQHQL